MHRSFLLGIATFQLVIATGHFITNLIYLMGGFLVHVNDPGGSEAYFQFPGQTVNIAVIFFFFTNVSATPNIFHDLRLTMNDSMSWEMRLWYVQRRMLGV